VKGSLYFSDMTPPTRKPIATALLVARGRAASAGRGALDAAAELGSEGDGQVVHPLGLRPPSQDRGQRRVDSILDAAAELFAAHGVEAVSVNAIAARAGSSVGSLYHFFPNKDAIVEALAARFCRQMVALNAGLLSAEAVAAPIDVVLGGVVDGFAHFHEANPAYDHVYQAALRAAGGRQSPVFEQVEQSIRETVDRYLALRLPAMPAAERGLYAATSVAAVHWLIVETLLHDPAERAGRLAHLKAMLIRYFEPADRAYGALGGAA
jgi:AcrR family transcriptional regulator